MNPLLEAFVDLRHGAAASPADVEALTAMYSFAVPTDLALQTIARWSPAGVVEIGAGTGYWASLLHGAGVDVVAFDPLPAASPASKWFSESTPWFPVAEADESAVTHHADRTLLLVWPTRDETWPADAVEQFHGAGGQTLVHVGEGPGGRTGDDRFHALLGEQDQCLACTYGVRDVACICDVRAQWRRVDEVVLPHWPNRFDDLRVYRRL